MNHFPNLSRCYIKDEHVEKHIGNQIDWSCSIIENCTVDSSVFERVRMTVLARDFKISNSILNNVNWHFYGDPKYKGGSLTIENCEFVFGEREHFGLYLNSNSLPSSFNPVTGAYEVGTVNTKTSFAGKTQGDICIPFTVSKCIGAIIRDCTVQGQDGQGDVPTLFQFHMTAGHFENVKIKQTHLQMNFCEGTFKNVILSDSKITATFYEALVSDLVLDYCNRGAKEWEFGALAGKPRASLVFNGCIIKGMSIKDTYLHGMVFQESDGKLGSQMKDSTFENCAIWKGSFAGCSFENVKLIDCDLYGIDFRRADLRGITGLETCKNIASCFYDASTIWPSGYRPDQETTL